MQRTLHALPKRRCNDKAKGGFECVCESSEKSLYVRHASLINTITPEAESDEQRDSCHDTSICLIMASPGNRLASELLTLTAGSLNS